jgi:hypothetical protein
MRGLLRFLVYASLGVGLVWSGSIAYHRLTEAGGGKHVSAPDAMQSAMWVP